MGFTLLIFALTLQNYFIYRTFWNKVGLNNVDTPTSFESTSANKITYLNYGNDLQSTRNIPSSSFIDAVGCAIALYGGYTAVIGRIGLTEIFFLTWIGTFIYEICNQIFIRLYIVDNGFGMRAYAFGGMLGLVSTLILGKK